MRSKRHVVGIVDQCIAGNSCLFMISLGDTTINYIQFAICLYRVLALLGLDRHMSVYDVGALGIKAELHQYLVGIRFHCGELVIGIEVLNAQFFLVSEENMFKGGYLVFSKERRIGAAPQIPHQIHGVLLFCRIILHVQEERIMDFDVQIVHQLFSLKASVSGGHGYEVPGVVHGNAAVIQQVPIHDLVDRALGVYELYVSDKELGMDEAEPQRPHQLLLSLRKLIGVLGINGGEIGIV